MAQVSKRVLDKEVEEQLFFSFWQVMAEREKEGEVAHFWRDMLTKTEKIVIAKRLAIAFLLLEKFTYKDIEYVLKVSPPTIAKVKEWMDEKESSFLAWLEEARKSTPGQAMVAAARRSLVGKETMEGEMGEMGFVSDKGGRKWVRE